MKILLLTDGIYPYVIGGMQKHSYNLARHLAEVGNKVHLVHCIYEGQLPQNQGKDITYFSQKALENLSFRCYHFPKLDQFPGHYIRENKRFAQMIYDDFKDQWQTYDFIYAKGFTAWKLLQEKANIPVPIGVNFHGYEMFQRPPSWKTKFAHLLLRNPVKYNTLNADYVFSYGGKITQTIQHLGVPLKQIIEIPTGISRGWLIDSNMYKTLHEHSSNSIRKFVFVGRYERRKGIEELHAAIQKLAEESLPPYEVHFIGPIPPEQQISADHIYYHGQITQSQKIRSLLINCDVLLCPSYSEGMPNVILEGMASGLAIIATDVGAVRQQLQKNGWLLPYSSVEGIKKAMKSAVLIPQSQLNEMKKVSLQLVQSQFLWEKVALKTMEKIAWAIEDYKRAN